MSMALEDLYREVIMDHYRSPHHKGRVEGATGDVEMLNPTCGDEIRVSFRVEDGRIADVAFQGRGCSISMASASMMTDAVIGKTVEEARTLIAAFSELMQGGAAGPELGDLVSLQGVARFPVRIKCATLPWTTLEKGLTAATDGVGG
ncbi:MAG TPA: SUF system NifU family Fe-S cluster assembly protein [Bacillota bacterium]|nr:SUF system NifU family Fe-S cluster assembly protein [Bacillota bacterium]